MYEKDGIIYADNQEELLKIVGVTPYDNKSIVVEFSTGEKKIFNVNSLKGPVFDELKRNPNIFLNSRINYGVMTWGDIDIAPEYVYENSSFYYE